VPYRLREIPPRKLAAYGIALLLYFGIRAWSFSNVEGPVTWWDTNSYLEVASHPIWEIDFWLGPRPPTVPLIFQMWGGDLEWVARFNVLLSAACWIYLAVSVAAALRTPGLRLVGFICVLLFSASSEILLWDSLMLSESVSLSLFALVSALWLRLLQHWNWTNAVLVIIASVVWVGARDTNALLLLPIISLLVLRALWRRSWTHELALIICFLAIFGMSNKSSHQGKRWVLPLMNVIGIRILPNPDRVEFFADHGMPVNPALMSRSGKNSFENDWMILRDPNLAPFRSWFHDEGKRTYLAFLLTHPTVLAVEPLRKLDDLLLSPMLFFYVRKNFIATPYGYGRHLLYPRGWHTLVLAAVALLMVLWCLRAGTNTLAVFAGLSILLVYPHAVIVWHGDSMEVARHSMSNAVQLRLGIWLAILATTDLLLRRHNTENKVAETTS